MTFWIQASNPGVTGVSDPDDRDLNDALQTVFPLNTEHALLVWNHVFVPLSYKYDLSVMSAALLEMLTACCTSRRRPSAADRSRWRRLHYDDLVRTNGGDRPMVAEYLLDPTPRCIEFLDPRRAEFLKSEEYEAKDADVWEATIDGSAVTTERALLASLGEALACPPGRPRDFDDLEAVLADPAWLSGAPCILWIPAAGDLWRKAPRACGGLVERWLRAAEHWAPHGRALHLMFEWEAP